MVIIVLLNDAFTWATPDTMFFRSRRRTRVASFAILLVLQARPSCQALGICKDRHPRAAPSGAPGIGFGRGRPTRPGLLLLAGNRLRLALAGPGVGVGALAADRERAPMAQPAIGAE